ncbi:MAG: hypothetical protein HYV39_01285 [Candidatus Levybacteria bacterium]|nr:hypothetical protein [Candidatus Levybacteria bacterium]
MKNILGKPKIIIGAVVTIVIVIVLFAIGVLSTAQQKEEVTQQPNLAPRKITFAGTKGKPTFSIKLPLGWAKAEDPRVDLLAGSITSEKLPSRQSFTVNINAVVDTHPNTLKNFADYQASWKDQMLGQYPSMKFVSDAVKKVNGMDVYVFEIKNPRPDGAVVWQIQYVFYVNDKYAVVVTGSAPDTSLQKYKNIIELSIESLDKVAP